MSIQCSQRILIVKLSAIGDVLHGLPVLNALRARLPAAQLAWLVEGRTSELLRGHPALDQLIVAPRGWLKSWRQIWEVRRQLQAFQPETTLDLQGLARSAIAAWLSGARRRIGFAHPEGREGSNLLNNLRVRPTAAHVVERNLQLLRPLGIKDPTVRFNLPRYAAEEATIGDYLGKQRLSEAYAVINPGAGWPSKRWDMTRFAAVAVHLGQHHRLPSLVAWAGQEERAMAEQVVAAAGGHACLAPPTSLRELAVLLRQARLCVSSDTGPLHLAVAVDTPSVGLFGPMPAVRNGPYGTAHVGLQRICLHGAKRGIRRASNDAMLALTVADVTQACDRLLQHRQAA